MSAIATGTTAHAPTIQRAAPIDSSPLASGRNGLLTRSISTSVISLTPTMKTFTHQPATSVHARSQSGGAVASSATST